MTKIILTSFFFILLISSSLSTTINCGYRDGTFIAVGRIYQCVVDSDPDITTQKSAKIEFFKGTHQRNKVDTDVVGFYAGRRTIQYFPNGLQYFQNLQSIQIISCKLKEIHQADLKPFAELILIYLESNLIEVLEEGLFAHNSNLKVIGFSQNKIVHIDANLFDHLTYLSDFLFSGVPCINLIIYSSVDKVKDAVKLAKTKCVNVDFMDLVDKVEKLEEQANSEDFEQKLKNLESEVKNSKFLDFRPINDKFEKLKGLSSKTSGKIHQSTVRSDVVTTFTPDTCSKSEEFTLLDSKLDNLTSNLSESINNVCSQFSDIKTSISNSESTQKTFQDTTTNSITSELKTTQETIKSLKNEVKETVSDTITALSDVKTNQIEIQASLSKLKTTQNEMKVSINDLRSLGMKNGNCEAFSDQFEKLEGQFGNFEEKLIENLEKKSAERFDKIEKKLIYVGHKISTNIDEKIKGIENRMMKKFEELQENLSKILEDKLNEVMNGRS